MYFNYCTCLGKDNIVNAIRVSCPFLIFENNTAIIYISSMSLKDLTKMLSSINKIFCLLFYSMWTPLSTNWKPATTLEI